MDEQKTGPVEKTIGGILAAGSVVIAVLTRNWVICLILVGFLLLLVLGYVLWRKWKRGRDEKRFSGGLDEQGGNANVRKAEQKAQLDQLRKAFQGGILVYKQRKKDIYSVPWYVMIGTPGSGKTEAIRHSEIGFPPGLTDPMTGVGGTINMNWWFTNYGVILDTAGKMVFPEAGGGGQSNEWDEFLRLLRKHRPACPINGLFLALDVDKMIQDTPETISKKAGQVAQQLDRIQRALDVRFPVYVLVTKSDFLTGFKEFFDGIDDPQLQNQILGWSNQAQLDAPVDANEIERYLRELVELIKRRRLAVMRAPISLDLQQNRRLDCTDAMYAFPESLERLIPRLKRYLQIIFSAGQFSAKPVFLRGIYFTSSMQQNGDLDEALAEFLGIKVTDLPPANILEKEKSFFLRDLFIEKAFPERLVTSASNTRRMRRNRLLILSGLTALILGSVVTFAWLGHRALNGAVGEYQLLFREAAASNQWVQLSYAPGIALWHPLISNDLRDASGDPLSSTYPNSMADFLATLTDRVSLASDDVPWIFRPLRSFRGNLPFKQAQRTLVEHGVLLPLLEAARFKMSQPNVPAPQGTAAVIRLRKALECLVQTQADIDTELAPLSDVAAQQKLAAFISPLLDFIVNTNVSVSSNFVAACAWTYSANGDGNKDWPPKILRRGTNLASDSAINTGLEGLIAQVGKNQQKVQDDTDQFKTVCDTVSNLASAEAVLQSDAVDCSVNPEHINDWKIKVKDLQSYLSQALHQDVLDISSSAGLLQAASAKIEQRNGAASSEAFKDIVRAAEAGRKSNLRPLFDQIAARCKQSADSMQGTVTVTLEKYRRLLPQWDADFLAAGDDGKRFFELRNNLYTNAFAFRDPDSTVPVGKLREVRSTWQRQLKDIRDQISSYKGPVANQLKLVCNCAIRDSDSRGLDTLLSSYFTGAEATITRYHTISPVTFKVIIDAHSFFSNLDVDHAHLPELALPIKWLDEFDKLISDYAIPAKLDLVKSYTNSVFSQLPARDPGDSTLQPYLSFRNQRDTFFTTELDNPVFQDLPPEPVSQFRRWANSAAGVRLDDYVTICENQLKLHTGFPVLYTSPITMSYQQVENLKVELNQRGTEFTKVQESDQTVAFSDLKKCVSSLSLIVAAFVPDPGRHVLRTINSHPDPTSAQNQCPIAWVSTGGQFQRLSLSSQRDPTNTLPADLSGPLEIKVNGDRDHPDATLSFCDSRWDNWGAVRLIISPNVQLVGGKWIVPLSVSNYDGTNTGNVFIELQVDPPLPDTTLWWRLTIPPP